MSPALELPSAYKGMWLFTMFDLPVVEKEERKAYSKFRKTLVAHGFDMMQYSVYARYLSTEQKAETIKQKLKPALPPGGHVRFLMVTDHQYGKMEVYIKRKPREPEKPYKQLAFF